MTAEPRFRVLVNESGQFSMWPLHKDAPAGWSDAGQAGSREECLAAIREAWTDLRPAHLRA